MATKAELEVHNIELIAKVEKLEDTNENLTELSRWLMGYVMELHDFRSNLTKREYIEKMPEDLKDEILMKFPMLQGTSNQRRFRELGLDKFNQEQVKNAVKYIEEKAS